ncbi:hypothetical protein GCM10009632_53590 [Mycolicibacterium alvei]|uniref:Lipoprotein n=2 Tax=Mycolicibacterium alvei TaxID=67081 RepID=A0A6N4UWG7_9MYCO|nr:hypothetical protein MALV_43650 [Mycolicibacterium alvei]
MPKLSALRVALSVLLLCFSLPSCDLVRQATRQSMDIDYNDQGLNDGLVMLLDENKSARLSDFTSWDWDEVHLFNEYSEREYIEKVVGAPVIKSKFLNSKANLLVFELNGKPVKAAGVSPDFLRPEDHRVTFPANTVLKPSGGGILMLTVPAN